MVREGVEEDTLGLSLGHLPSTALPGQEGNVAVAGHRDTLFRGLGAIHPNDLVLFETPGGNYTYQVEATKIVKPEDVSVLKAGEHPELTLITCYPFYYVGSAPDRFIVKARQVSAGDSAAVVEKDALPAQPQPPHTDSAQAEPAVRTEPGRTEPDRTEPDQVEPPRTVQHQPEDRRAVRRSSANRAAPAVRSVKTVPSDSGDRRVSFSVSTQHSRELAPGISLGVTRTDATDRRVDGWMWVMPDRRTIWLRSQRARQPVVFYGAQDGRRRELVITAVTRNSIAGYLVVPPVSHGKTRAW
jgi:sortase A